LFHMSAAARTESGRVFADAAAILSNSVYGVDGAA